MSDDSELIKAGTQGLVEGTLAPFHQLILSLFGPAAEEAGLILRDYVRHFHERQQRFLERTSSVLSDANIEPQLVPLKLLKPIFDNASIEDDDDLQDIWSNLLANAADPRQTSPVHVSFAEILRELSARDVKFLNRFHAHALGRVAEDWPLENVKYEMDWLLEIYGRAGLARRTWSAPLNSADLIYRDDLGADLRYLNLTLDVLLRNRLLTTSMSSEIIRFQKDPPKLKTEYSLTHLGAQFIAACTAPKK